MKKIALLGGGEIGKAISFVLSKKGIDPIIFDVDPGKCNTTLSFEEIFKTADIIFVCVPSEVLRVAVKPLAPFISEDQIIIPISKGMVDGKLPYEIVKDEVPNASVVLLSGAMIAEEILKGNNGFALVAGEENVSKKIEEIFSGSALVLNKTEDFVGVSYVGILKNIYSVIVGMFDTLGFGKNTLGAVVLQSFKEMRNILVMMGGKEETLNSFAGISDFIATAFSEDSANRNAGKNIATGNMKIEGEGLRSLDSMVMKIGGEINKLPLLLVLKQVVLEKKDVRKTLEEIIF